MPGRKLEAKKVKRKKAADTVYFVTDEGMMNRASTKCMPWHGLYTLLYNKEALRSLPTRTCVVYCWDTRCYSTYLVVVHKKSSYCSPLMTTKLGLL